MAAFRLIPKEEKFFEDFIQLADRIVSGATLLERMLSSEPPNWDVALQIRQDDAATAIMSRFRARDPLDRIFEIGIILKGLDGALEAVGGLLLLAVNPATIDRVMVRLTQHELSEDPRDFIARHLLRYSHGLTGSAVTFAAVYLLAHGIVKIVLVAALLRNQAWAYPWMIGFLLIFIGYQVYRLALSPTFWLTALTVFDALIVWLTWREWRRQTADRALAVRD